MKDTLPDRVRLGVFDLDLRAGELRSPDRTIRLQQQPFQILLMLMERAGKIVTRDEIQRKLWPNDTVVEFDHSINAAIKKLRQALADSADEPKYVETVARRGYRLLVPVERSRAYPGEASAAVSDLRPAQEIQPETPVANQNTQLHAAATSAGLIGKKVSHYRVLEVIGGGGMGLVYKAEDLKLGRQVALKFLPEELAWEPAALRRFEREARYSSSMNHPNICTVYEIEDYEGQPFLVMELLEGQTLRDRLAAGAAHTAVSLEELLDIGIQVSDGLQAAHEKGIIHRDIKPANIFICRRGTCKILDFGVAKLVDAAKRSGSDSAQIGPEGVAREVSLHETTVARTGLAIGTVGYMSPEQVRREKLDARTDIFSLGLVLYEMATGERAFSGETEVILHDAILHREPKPIRELAPKLPPGLSAIIDKCLEKDRERRYRSVVDLHVALSGVNSEAQCVETGKPTSRAWWKLVATAVAILLIAAVFTFRWSTRHTAELTDKDTILVAELNNSSGDPLFDDGLKTALNVYFEQSPFLNLLSDRKLRTTLKLMNRPINVRLTEADGREVCLRTNSRALVTGSISDIGNRYQIDLRAIDCHSGAIIASARSEADDRDKVIAALGEAGADLRKKLGEPAGLRKKFDTPLDKALTSSPEALRAYSLAAQVPQAKKYVESIPYLRRAVELDPNFAAAFVDLGIAYHNLGSDSLATESFKRFYDLRGQLTARQRLEAEGLYYFAITGEMEKYAEVLREEIRAYPIAPDTDWWHGDLSLTYYSLGRHEEALPEAREQVRANPTSYVSYMALVRVYCALGRLDDAMATSREAQSQNADGLELRVARYVLAFAQDDKASMDEQLAWAKDQPALEHFLLSAASDTETYYGRFSKARELSQRAEESARNFGDVEAAAAWRGQAALREAEVGNSDRSRQMATLSLTLSNPYDLKALAALTFAAAGDAAEAQKLADQVNQERPLDDLIQYYWLPMIRAGIQMNQNDSHKAVRELTVASRYELGSPGIKQEPFGNLYPVYVRGKAYLQAGQGQQAATEFQKILDHRGLVSNFIIGALAHLQLARAQAMMGDNAAARRSYQDFLTLWKDADPDIPVYKQAKAEYAKLL